MARRLVLTVAALLFCGVAPAWAQDAADFVVRMSRLENQVRQLSGQLEQVQFENRQLRDQLRKFQEDVDFRLEERGGGARPAASSAAQPSAASQPPSAPPQARPGRRGDAFDPSASPEAPGAPRSLGANSPSAPLTSPGPVASAAPPAPARPQGATGGGPTIGSLIEDETPSGAGAPLDLGATGRAGVAAPQTAPPRPGPSVAATGSGDARADYDGAYAYILQRQYEQAEMGFRQFLQSHPRDRLVPDAIYWLGESYLARNRHREAAEQFLKISTEHARSAKAPDAMLKLGIALNALGARDQACATFAELERKYPQAAGNVRQGVEREQKRARCA